jgi:septal ring factor EnvC (AmiA/AmiB activator)
MSLSDQVLMMKQSLADVEEHLSKLQAGRKASSAKARASLMSLKKNSHQLRSDITKFTKELPTKSRVKKQPDPESVVGPEPEPESVVGPEPTTNVKPKARSKSKK